MRFIIATALFAIGFGSIGLGSAQAADACGPGCHSAVNGGCVVDGWERGAAVWNECPAGAHASPPCGSYYVWRKNLKACLRLN
jgi:hypothetical protein